MDDYEVDLIDYLRVMWWGKWIIIACFVLAVGVSAAIVLMQPNEYRGMITYRISQFSQVFGVSALDGQQISNAIEGTRPSFLNAHLSLQAKVEDDQIKVTLTGSVPRTALSDSLTLLTPFVKGQLQALEADAVSQATGNMQAVISQLDRQKELLTQQMDEITPHSPDNPLFAALAQKVADLEAALAEQQAHLEILSNTSINNLLSVKTLGTSSTVKIGPNRKMSVAVAGVLGLFIGVLLAFFVHYLINTRSKEASRKQA